MDKGALTMDAMFRICTEFTMPDGEAVTVRTLSDTEVQTRNRLALEASRGLLSELRDESSAKYQELIAPLQTLDREQMVSALVVIREREMRREALDEIPFQFIPIPDGADLEERQSVLEKREVGEAEVRLKREAWVGKQLEVYREKVAGLEPGSLLAELKGKTVAAYTFADFLEHTQYATLMMACYRNDGQRYFDSIEQVRAISSKVLNELFVAYREVDNVDPWELTKNV